MVGEGGPYPVILPYMSFYTSFVASFSFDLICVFSDVAKGKD
jgi:hypothetical protein